MKSYTVNELISALNQNILTSTGLVEMYSQQIKLFDGYLNSVAELNPEAMSIAKQLDEERKQGKLRSPLHGIPILIKDNINTKDQMHTTANSYALADLIAPYEATVVEKLRDAGLILLGKANLSEFAYFMSYDDMPSGYGSRNGQVKSPYHPDIDPLGSSTGSGVAVAANLIPLAVGTETNGSLMAPAYQNSIVSIKPTFGLISRYGIIPISETQDTAGPMALSVHDAALLLDVMVGYDPKDRYSNVIKDRKFDFANASEKEVQGKKVLIISFSNHPYEDEEIALLDEAKEKLESVGILVEQKSIEAVEMKNDASLLYEFKHGLNQYLDSVKGFTKMTSLKSIIDFNIEHKEKCLKYGQSILEAAEKTSGDLRDPQYMEIRKSLLKDANLFEEIMQKNSYDAILSTWWMSYAPIAGNPSICVPAKALVDQKPRSIVFVGKKFDDENLIAIAHTYEKLTQHRIPPKMAF